MDILYFTSGARHWVLRALLDAGHSVHCVFATDPAHWPKVEPTLDLARMNGIPVRIVSKRDLPSLVGVVSGRFCLSVGFAYIFPKAVISASSEFLNVHGTLLPKYSGARSLNWILANSEAESGVTVHRIDAGIDTGPILLQKAFPLSKFESFASIARKTAEFEPHVVIEALSLLENGGGEFVDQVSRKGQDFPDREPVHSEIDPKQPLSSLFDHIRACDSVNYPAYFYVDGEKVCIKIWRPEKPEDESDLI